MANHRNVELVAEGYRYPSNFSSGENERKVTREKGGVIRPIADPMYLIALIAGRNPRL